MFGHEHKEWKLDLKQVNFVVQVQMLHIQGDWCSKIKIQNFNKVAVSVLDFAHDPTPKHHILQEIWWSLISQRKIGCRLQQLHQQQVIGWFLRTTLLGASGA